MICCILIDNKINSLEMMEWLLKTYCPSVKIKALCNSAQMGIEAIKRYKTDVIFFDIEMPHANGFDIIKQCDRINFNIVFCTAYNQFAIKAFKYSALNYLLMPVASDDLVETVRRKEAKKAIPSREQNS